ncbi:ABC transporter substrate-binding protein [Acidisphaera sp. L21]|uniref:ABC transporter substrate-binding protein n=1 Tax=Acidisphaera sp. L21 TaxID=1641851 RepID=UPI00131E29FC|nr:extracellular solute-binding protein [Acidisphaera sp. L21]
MKLSRRTALLGAATSIAASSSRAQGSGDSAGIQALYAAAKKEGQVGWYSGVLDQPLCDQIGQAFTKRYPGISVSAVKTTSQVAFQRLTEDLRGGTPQCDIFTSTDVGHMSYLIGKQLLVKFTAEGAAGMAKSLQDFDKQGYFQVSWVGQVALLYNTAKVSAADSPKDWPDLTDAKWKDKISFGSPNYSGIVGVWSVAMENKYGWSYFDKLNKLNPLIGRSVDDATTVLNSGERVVAAGNPSSALRSAAKGNPLAVNYPPSGMLVDLSPSAIIKGSKNPNAAKLFIEFLASAEYSQILADAFEQPLRDDVSPPKGAKSLTDVKFFSPTPEEIEKQLPANKQKWRDTFTG